MSKVTKVPVSNNKKTQAGQLRSTAQKFKDIKLNATKVPEPPLPEVDPNSARGLLAQLATSMGRVHDLISMMERRLEPLLLDNEPAMGALAGATTQQTDLEHSILALCEKSVQQELHLQGLIDRFRV